MNRAQEVLEHDRIPPGVLSVERPNRFLSMDPACRKYIP